MNKRMVTWQKIVFELRVIMGNPFIYAFGFGLPVLLSIVLVKSITAGITDSDMIRSIATQTFLGVGTIIPMATILMGYSLEYVQEIEQGTTERMALFGITVKETIANRILAELFYVAVAFVLYFGIGTVITGISMPTIGGFLIYAGTLLLIGVNMFILGHGIATLCRKFGLTFFVTMSLYFAIMIVSGLMGVPYDSLPKGIRAVARLIPMTHINDGFLKVWEGEAYNFAPLVQSFLFVIALSVIFLFLTVRREERKLQG